MNLKYLDEQRAENHNKMQEILESAKKEERALSEDEISKFNELKKLIGEIDATIKAEEESREMDIEEKSKEKEKENENVGDQETKEPVTEDEKKEERAFAEYIVSGKQILKESSKSKMSKKEAEKICKEVIDSNKKAVKDYVSGKKKAINSLIEEVMKKTNKSLAGDEVLKILKKQIEKQKPTKR